MEFPKGWVLEENKTKTVPLMEKEVSETRLKLIYIRLTENTKYTF